MRFGKIGWAAAALTLLALVVAGAWWWLAPEESAVRAQRTLPTPEVLEAHCREAIGPPRVERVGERIYVAIGYDLANTILIRTDDGNVVIDVGMNPERARQMREALAEVAPGPTRAIVYTHSHIDHVGGASVWVDEGTEVWATDRFVEHFFKQYGRFQRVESQRGARQMGWHVDEEALPCSALGRRIAVEASLKTGVRMPTRTFTGRTSFEVGGVEIELMEAHGETHDQLFVWLPGLGALMPGDNYYLTFPNLYTIRGTSPRPVDAWIDSIDRMRRLAPEHLVPSHTVPVSGRDEVARELTHYRDGIQWVRDQVVRGAHAGRSVDAIAASAGLPEALADVRNLVELYGQVDWSARAIYTNELGWFDGRPEALYPLPPADRARRTVEMMGGEEAVLREARRAREEDDARWSVHLLATLRDAAGDGADGAHVKSVREELARSLRAVAEGVHNTNGRGYLLESAHELEHGVDDLPKPEPDDALVDVIPLDLLFEVLATRLIPERAPDDVHETAVFDFGEDGQYVVTVRNRVAEVVRGEPLPGTPEPLAVVHTDGNTWRRVAVGMGNPASAVANGDLKVEGDPLAFYRFVDRFRRGL
jgi:alkyl sulfatase BDS1-like metallo-beta-lactamase superfamily hydrolase